MKRPLALTLSLLALLGSAEAGRRSSGGGFGGSSRSSSSYSSPSRPAPSRTPSYSPPANSSSGSAYTRPRSVPVTPKPKLSKPAPPRSTPVRDSGVTSSPTPTPSPAPVPNRAPMPSVSQSQLNAWKSAPLPAGVPRRALTYQTSPSGDYRYQLEKGRYYPYPQSYYRQHSIGYDLLKYALIFTAVSSVADALDGPDVVVGNVQDADFGNELRDVTYSSTPVPVPAGPNLWPYVGVGLFAAAAAWFIFGRKR